MNLRFLITNRQCCLIPPRDRDLIVGMVISSSGVILFSVPSVILQCFLCHSLCSSWICTLEGFNSFFHGCTLMYILVALSIVRYVTTASSSFSRTFQYKIKQHKLLLVMICFVLGGIWTVPPIFHILNRYVPEGLGFHCSLDWFSRSFTNRLYFFALFMGVYFIPISIIVYVNIYIQRTVYRLTHLLPTVLFDMNKKTPQSLLRKHISQTLCEKEAQRLHCLYEDHRFVKATRVSGIIYLIAWTPYSIVALIQAFGLGFSLYNPSLMTAWALLAKLSMITNPIIFISVIKSREANGTL